MGKPGTEVPGQPATRRVPKGRHLPAQHSNAFARSPRTTRLLSSVPLRAGKQYWIVAGTGLGQDNSEYQWNFVWHDASGKVAFLNGNTNDQWLPDTDNVAAFAVFGVVHEPHLFVILSEWILSTQNPRSRRTAIPLTRPNATRSFRPDTRTPSDSRTPSLYSVE